MKIAVLGAGVSGLSAARMLHDKGHEVVVYEKNPTIGGLARSRYVNGMLYDPHGGHILNSKHKEVMDWVFSILMLRFSFQASMYHILLNFHFANWMQTMQWIVFMILYCHRWGLNLITSRIG